LANKTHEGLKKVFKSLEIDEKGIKIM